MRGRNGAKKPEHDDGIGIVSSSDLLIFSAAYYISIGMPREEYWHGDLFAAYDYLEAEKIRQHRKNQEMMLQGVYVYRAIGAYAAWLGTPLGVKNGNRPKPEPYDTELIPLTEEDAKKLEERQEADRLEKTRQYFSGGGG